MTDGTATSGPKQSRLLLLKEAVRPIDPDSDLQDLRQQLRSMREFEGVEPIQNGRSTALLYLSATNKRHMEQLKATANQQLRGWKVIEEQSYGLPTTF
jgi:hypothetical protein